MSCRRATTDTEAPGGRVSSTIRRFSSTAQDRRLGRAVSTIDLTHDSRDADRVHYPMMDTIKRHARAGRSSQAFATRHRPP